MNLSLKLPGYDEISPPGDIPQGGVGTVEKIIQNGITIFIIVGVIITLIFLILGGIQWITSGGDKEALQKARKRITFAVIGIVVILLALLIVNIIGGLLGVNLTSPKYQPVPTCIQTNCNGVNCNTLPGKTCQTVTDPLEGNDSCVCK